MCVTRRKFLEMALGMVLVTVPAVRLVKAIVEPKSFSTGGIYHEARNWKPHLYYPNPGETPFMKMLAKMGENDRLRKEILAEFQHNLPNVFVDKNAFSA